MKKLILIVFLLISAKIFAQPNKVVISGSTDRVMMVAKSTLKADSGFIITYRDTLNYKYDSVGTLLFRPQDTTLYIKTPTFWKKVGTGTGGGTQSYPYTTLKYPTGYNTFGSFKDTVLATVLAGYSSTTGTITTSDNIQGAIGKLNGNIGLKLNISDTASMIANYPLKDGTRTTSWTVNGPITATSANVTGNMQFRGNGGTVIDSVLGKVAGSDQVRTVALSQISITSVNTESAIASYNGSASVIVSADPSYPGIYYYSTGSFTPTAHFIIAATGIGTGYWLYRYTPFAGLSGVPTTLAGYGITDGTKYKTVATYALMVADGTPSITTIYEVVADENKGYSRSTYIWKPSGNREWVATTTDN